MKLNVIILDLNNTELSKIYTKYLFCLINNTGY